MTPWRREGSARWSTAPIGPGLTYQSGRDATVREAFLKEVSTGSYTNTVDVISPAMPVWLHLDPEFSAMLLRPILTYAAPSQWKNDWAPHDLGRYPQAPTSTGGLE